MIVCAVLVASVLLGILQAAGSPVSLPINRAPYEILIVQKIDKNHVVGTGAILNDQWVITTASSVNMFRNKPHSLMIRSGSGVYNQGGGLHENGKNSKFLKLASTNIENWERCRALFSSELLLDDRTLCTQKSSMKVQEGSSLISDAQLIGLYKSFNSSNIKPEMDVYIDIASYKFWINEIIVE